jgi:DNA-binding LacI/PurR family transcriptional regulator
MDNKIYEVARRSGVSISTVSRVFNSTATVRESTKKKVIEAATMLNYRPKIVARKDFVALVVGGSDMIAPGIYESSVIKYLTKELMQHNVNFEMIPSCQIKELKQSFASAVICINHEEQTQKDLCSLKNIPVMTINNVIDGIHSVCSDHKGGIIKTVNLLHQKGHRNIAFIQVAELGWGANERKRGYIEALEQLKLKDLWAVALAQNTLLKRVSEVIKNGATAIIFDGEDMSLPAYYTLNLLNYKIPEDISVITLECEKMSPYLLPAPTTLKQPIEEMTEFAVDAILKLMDNNKVPTIRKLFNNSIIERDSISKK